MLPQVSLPSADSPFPARRFALSTPEAIQSGVLYGALATVRDFTQAFHQDVSSNTKGSCVLTGGDAALLHAALKSRQQQQQQQPSNGGCWELKDDLTFRGLHWVVKAQGWIDSSSSGGVIGELPLQAHSTDNL